MSLPVKSRENGSHRRESISCRASGALILYAHRGLDQGGYIDLYNLLVGQLGQPRLVRVTTQGYACIRGGHRILYWGGRTEKIIILVKFSANIRGIDIQNLLTLTPRHKLDHSANWEILNRNGLTL